MISASPHRIRAYLHIIAVLITYTCTVSSLAGCVVASLYLTGLVFLVGETCGSLGFSMEAHALIRCIKSISGNMLFSGSRCRQPPRRHKHYVHGKCAICLCSTSAQRDACV